MKTYSKAQDETVDRVAHLKKLFHPELINAGVKIDLISVATDGEGDALKLHGYPCLAVVRIVSTKDRAKGHGDAEIVIDEEKYLRLSDPERDALLDHELYHIEVKVEEDKNGKEHIKLDAQGRPCLKLRKHDHDFGWFAEIAERHGAASQECKQAQTLVLEGRQTYFAFVGDSACLMPPHEPSEKVKKVAAEIMAASPAVQAAAKNLVANLRKHNATMTIKTGDTEATIK